MRRSAGLSRRGAPLAVLAMLLSAWIGMRVLLWEAPAGWLTGDAQSPTGTLFAARGDAVPERLVEARPDATRVDAVAEPLDRFARSMRALASGGRAFGIGHDRDPSTLSQAPQTALQARSAMPRATGLPVSDTPPPFVPPAPEPAPDPAPAARPDRWALDSWVFVREGSRSAPIAQTRTPIYGASQAGGRLHYRLAPRARSDPRAFVRAYTALVPGGESEVALGLSARPLASLPVRAVAELRATDDLAGSELRPAAMAFTEIAPVGLPGGASLEVYGSAGYVGGRADTGFADGQVTVMRALASIEGPAVRDGRLSLGAGAWGGAQRGAGRVDIGPSLRFDMRLAEVPARLSLDYRARVAGDAAPGSGLAATLSTRF